MFVWSDFLALAEDLKGRTEESAHRSAVSRAYYAAYHQALAKLPPAEAAAIRRSRDGESHIKVWEAYKRGPHRIRIAIGTHGVTLKMDRQKADYKDADKVGPKDAAAAVQRARTIFTQLDLLVAVDPP